MCTFNSSTGLLYPSSEPNANRTEKNATKSIMSLAKDTDVPETGLGQYLTHHMDSSRPTSTQTITQTMRLISPQVIETQRHVTYNSTGSRMLKLALLCSIRPVSFFSCCVVGKRWRCAKQLRAINPETICWTFSCCKGFKRQIRIKVPEGWMRSGYGSQLNIWIVRSPVKAQVDPRWIEPEQRRSHF